MKSTSNCRSRGWLDSLAIGMSMICAIHCLLTPVLIVLLPILATTFWVHKDFHLWMILFVVPTTTLAVFMGCRKHKDRAVVMLAMAGLSLLVAVAAYETMLHSAVAVTASSDCSSCAVCSAEGSAFSARILINVLGGLLLAGGHVRNFLLCRRSACSHNL